MLGLFTIAAGVISVVVTVVVVVGVVIASRKPDEFRVERTITIHAPPDRIFPLIDDLHCWNVWSPWDKLDSQMQRTYGGAAHGTGATYAWSGNRKVGQGKMEISESVPPRRIVIQLHFLKPFPAHNQTEFTLESHSRSTTVTWTMTGPNPLMSKLMQLVMNMDQMIGRDFETGLRNLKAAVEAPSTEQT